MISSDGDLHRATEGVLTFQLGKIRGDFRGLTGHRRLVGDPDHDEGDGERDQHAEQHPEPAGQQPGLDIGALHR